MKRGPARGRGLPVDPERLRREFPNLTEGDLEAYVAVTSRLLADPANRARMAREVLERGRAARARAEQGGALSAEEDLARRYVAALEKMQGATARRTH